MATQSQIIRTSAEWSKIAGEKVELEVIGSFLYSFGSELATLRLYRSMPNGRQNFSKNTGKFYFCVELL